MISLALFKIMMRYFNVVLLPTIHAIQQITHGYLTLHPKPMPPAAGVCVIHCATCRIISEPTDMQNEYNMYSKRAPGEKTCHERNK